MVNVADIKRSVLRGELTFFAKLEDANDSVENTDNSTVNSIDNSTVNSIGNSTVNSIGNSTDLITIKLYCRDNYTQEVISVMPEGKNWANS